MELNRSKWSRDKARPELYLKATRFLVLHLNLFADLELPGVRRADRKRAAKAFVVLVYFCYFYCNTRFIIQLWLSYKYNFLVHDYKRFLSASDQCKTDATLNCILNLTALAMDHLEQIKEARERVQAVGAPYLEVAFVSEAALVIFLIFTFYACIILRLYLNLVETIKSELLCLILNEDEGRRRVEAMVDKVVERLKAHQRRKRYGSLIQFPQNGLLHKPLDHHLKVLESQGCLQPANRQPGRILDLCKVFCLFAVIVGIGFYAIVTFFMFGVLRLFFGGTFHLRTDPMALRLLGNILLLLLITVSCMALYLSILAMNLVDQIQAALKLTQDCRACVRESAESWLLSRTSWMLLLQEHQDKIDLMDRNLLDLIVKFKLYRLQIRSSLPFNSFIVFLSANLAAYGPIIACIHGFYLEREMVLVIDALLIVILSVITTIWAPNCYMYSRCEDIYRGLYSLMAHIANSEIEHGAHFYHPQLVNILHRELTHPEKLIDDFACQFLGIRFTYRDLLKYQFFYGLGLIIAYSLHRNKDNTASLFTLL